MKLSPLTKENCTEIRITRNEYLFGLRTPFLLTQEMQEDFYQNIVCNRTAPHRYWAFMNEYQFVGMGGLTNIQWENELAEISLIIKQEFQEEGLGKKGVGLLLDQAFNYLNLNTVCGECYLCNPAVKFWEKITKKYNGYSTKLPNRKYWNGKFWDALYFSIGKDEFRKAHSTLHAT